MPRRSVKGPDLSREGPARIVRAEGQTDPTPRSIGGSDVHGRTEEPDPDGRSRSRCDCSSRRVDVTTDGARYLLLNGKLAMLERGDMMMVDAGIIFSLLRGPGHRTASPPRPSRRALRHVRTAGIRSRDRYPPRRGHPSERQARGNRREDGSADIHLGSSSLIRIHPGRWLYAGGWTPSRRRHPPVRCCRDLRDLAAQAKPSSSVLVANSLVANSVS